MQKAILHTATRVIVGLTIDPEYTRTGDYSTVELAEAIDLKPVGETKYWKLDVDNKKVPATLEEIEASRIDPDKEALRKAELRTAYESAIGACAADKTLPQSLQEYFMALTNLQS